MGYRVWYDEGIDPATSSRKEVAGALSRSSQFIVFVTRRAIASRNVRNEINCALNMVAVAGECAQLRPALRVPQLERVIVFDPAAHQAVVSDVPAGGSKDLDLPRGTIVRVRRAGYRLNGGVLRIPQVIIAP